MSRTDQTPIKASQTTRPPITGLSDPTKEEWIQLFEDVRLTNIAQVHRNNPDLSYSALQRRSLNYFDGKIEQATKLYRFTGGRKRKLSIDKAQSKELKQPTSHHKADIPSINTSFEPASSKRSKSSVNVEYENNQLIDHQSKELQQPISHHKADTSSINTSGESDKSSVKVEYETNQLIDHQSINQSISIGQTFNPTNNPSFDQTFNPTNNPSFDQTFNPTNNPSFGHTFNPIFNPINNPSSFGHTFNPIFNPTNNPSFGQPVKPTNNQSTSISQPVKPPNNQSTSGQPVSSTNNQSINRNSILASLEEKHDLEDAIFKWEQQQIAIIRGSVATVTHNLSERVNYPANNQSSKHNSSLASFGISCIIPSILQHDMEDMVFKWEQDQITDIRRRAKQALLTVATTSPPNNPSFTNAK